MPRYAKGVNCLLCWKCCGYEEIRELKKNLILELVWDYFEEGGEREFICKYEMNAEPIAFIRVSIDPMDNNSVWIDEFEVVKAYRKQGIGKKLILEFLDKVNCDVKIMAKNKQVQIFWEKCGFEDDGITWAEIPMIHKLRKNSN